MFQILYFLQHATIESQICHGLDRCGIWIYYFFYSSFSLISFIFSFSYSPPHLHSPILFLLPSSILLYSLLIHESWATTNFLSTISQIPSSLIYKISFTGFFSPLLFALSSLFYLKVAYQRGSVVGLWFPIMIGVGVGLWIVGLWLWIVIGVGLWVMVGFCVCVWFASKKGRRWSADKAF